MGCHFRQKLLSKLILRQVLESDLSEEDKRQALKQLALKSPYIKALAPRRKCRKRGGGGAGWGGGGGGGGADFHDLVTTFLTSGSWHIQKQAMSLGGQKLQ